MERMKEILDYIYESQFDNLVINESFQSTFLRSLAKKIKDSESKRVKSENTSQKEKDKLTSSFSNIFQTILDKKTNEPINIKWTDIKDEDFVLYKANDKSFKKICSAIFDPKLANNQKAIIISCKPDTKEIICFTNALNGKFYKDSWSRDNGPVILQFDVPYTWWKGRERGTDKKLDTVRKSTRGYNNYRQLNQYEAWDYLKDKDNYYLEIPNSMLYDYKQISDKRKDLKKGMINFDDESLEKILIDQKNRYKAFIDSVKIKKLRTSDKELYDEIKDLNNEIIKLNEEIMNNSNNWDLLNSMGNLLRDFSYAFYYYYKYFINNKKSEIGIDPNVSKIDANSNLKQAKKELDKFKEKINNIKSVMKNG